MKSDNGGLVVLRGSGISLGQIGKTLSDDGITLSTIKMTALM
jgi:hypothetical protein